ncbi:ligase [Aureococcus anophagefferens]|nr:ligase [Aureococcus anophagefferens]
MIATRLARAAPMRAAIRLLSGERPVNSFPKTAANYRELTPLSYVERAAVVFDDSPAVVDGDATRTWAETFARCCGLGDALRREGCGRGDAAQVMLDNTGGDARRASSSPTLLRWDLRPPLGAANPPRLVVVGGPGATYEAFVASGDAGSGFVRPRDEWDALAVNYTSGTTGRPKGVVLHHRGAYILALSNAVDFGASAATDLPLPLDAAHAPPGAPRRPASFFENAAPGRFHCNGWGFLTLPAVGGANVCLRDVSADAIADAFVAASRTSAAPPPPRRHRGRGGARAAGGERAAPCA